jgi:hypothetical protein
MSNTYTAGSLVRVTASFFNALTQSNADPSTVTLKVSTNRGTTSTYIYGQSAVGRDGVGLYHFDIDTTNLPGNWNYEWIGTGAIQAIDSAWFVVNAAPL